MVIKQLEEFNENKLINNLLNQIKNKILKMN